MSCLADSVADLPAVWSGADRSAFELNTVLGTTALALDTLGVADPEIKAQVLWDSRFSRRVA